MYAFSTRCDLPLFSSLFRAKIRTRILSTSFGAIRASNRRPINPMKKVNLLYPSKYSLPLSGLPLPAWLHASASALSPSFHPVVATSFRTSIGVAQSPRFTPRLTPSRHNAMGSLLGSHRGLRSSTRHPTSTNENSPEFSQKRKLEGVQAQFYAAAIRQCKMKKKSSFIRSSGEIEGLSTPLLRASVRRI